MGMARRAETRGTEYVALPQGAIEGDFQGAPVSDEEMAFDEFIAGMSAEQMGELRIGKIKIEKDGTPVANAKGAHCFSCPIDQFTYSGLLEHIRRRHGAGLYRIVGVEKGKRGLAFNRLIEIAEELNPEKPTDSPLQNPANMLESVGRIMAESASRTEALIARLTESRAAAVPPPDPMDQLTKLATLFSTMMGAMPKPVEAGGGGDLLTQLEKLAKIKELLGGFGGSDGGGAESNFFDVVKTGIASFGPALAQLALRGAQQPNAALPAPAVDSATVAVQPAHIPPHAKQPGPARAANTGEDMASLKKQVDILVANAKMGADPVQLADTILDLTPDEKLDDLEAMLEAPDMVEKMAALNPEVRVYREFFDKLKASLLSLLAESDPDTLPDAGTAASPSPGNSGAPTA